MSIKLDIHTLDQLQKYISDIFKLGNVETLVRSVSVTQTQWDRIYVITAQSSEMWSIMYGRASIEITHAKGILIVINEEYR